jgi:hypothetical protein
MNYSLKQSLKLTFTGVFCLVATSAAGWQIKGDKIKTEWADKVSPENVWQNYPRPQLKRAEWINNTTISNKVITRNTV